MQLEKKFKPQKKAFKENSICSLYRVRDENDQEFFAKIFMEQKMIELNIFQSSEYNQAILSDLSDQQYPQQFLQISYTYSVPDGFIFVTEPYEMNLQTYLKSKVIQQVQAMEIVQQISKAVYSLYMAGFWHRNIRPEHFVKVDDKWKMESLVYNQQYEEAEGVQSEYLWNPAYQPPELYGKKIQLQAEEMDNLVVWNVGSLLLDMLLGHHKLKDLSIINKYKNKQFSFKSIGVKRKFTSNIQKLLAKMLHYDPKKRMKINEFFSSEEICPEVAKKFKRSNNQRTEKIYVAGNSSLALTLSKKQSRNQCNLKVDKFAVEKQKFNMQKQQSFRSDNNDKLQTTKELRRTIDRLSCQLNELKFGNGPTKNNAGGAFKSGAISNFQPIIQQQKRNDIQHQRQSSRLSDGQSERFQAMLDDPYLRPAIQCYKCQYDKCALLKIAANKIQKLQSLKNQQQTNLLNKFSMTFVSLMHLHQLAESMNQNVNYFDLEENLWSQFQASIQFKGLKQIINFHRKERKIELNGIREQLLLLKQKDRYLLQQQQIQDFVHANYKTCTFDEIKGAYRKILKFSYDNVSKQYNKERTNDLARIGMYITYCMSIDKLYIADEITDNFKHYFEWLGIAPKNYISNQQFQDYLDNADRKLLVANSIYILKKFFYRND